MSLNDRSFYCTTSKSINIKLRNQEVVESGRSERPGLKGQREVPQLETAQSRVLYGPDKLKSFEVTKQRTYWNQHLKGEDPGCTDFTLDSLLSI